jgi:hypothetical protein
MVNNVYRHQKYIGKVKHAVFQTQKTGRKRVLVSTEENAIASLDLRHGEICKFRLMDLSNAFFNVKFRCWSSFFFLIIIIIT